MPMGGPGGPGGPGGFGGPGGHGGPRGHGGFGGPGRRPGYPPPPYPDFWFHRHRRGCLFPFLLLCLIIAGLVVATILLLF